MSGIRYTQHADVGAGFPVSDPPGPLCVFSPLTPFLFWFLFLFFFVFVVYRAEPTTSLVLTVILHRAARGTVLPCGG